MNRRERAAYAAVGAGTTITLLATAWAAHTAWNALWRWLYTGRAR